MDETTRKDIQKGRILYRFRLLPGNYHGQSFKPLLIGERQGGDLLAKTGQVTQNLPLSAAYG